MKEFDLDMWAQPTVGHYTEGQTPRAIPAGALQGSDPQCSASCATSATNATSAIGDVEPLPKPLSTQRGDVEMLVKAIEEKQVDIASSYDDWVRVGIALASEMGESGRSLFHRISQYYIKYNIAETDKKFNQCLRDPNPSVGLGTVSFPEKR